MTREASELSMSLLAARARCTELRVSLQAARAREEALVQEAATREEFVREMADRKGRLGAARVRGERSLVKQACPSVALVPRVT